MHLRAFRYGHESGPPKRRGRRATMIGAVAAVLLIAAGLPISAQTGSDDVSTTVTATSSCLTVEASSVDFGVNAFSTDTDDSAGDTVAVGQPDTVGTSGVSYALTNCSSADQSFLASGTDAQNAGATTTWTLDGDAPDLAGGICNDPDGGTNRYRMDVVNDANDDDVLGGGEPGTFLSTGSQVLNDATGIAGGSQVHVANRIVMPCTGSDGADEAMSATITYTATLD